MSSFRHTYSRIENSAASRAESSLEAVLFIGGFPMGRIQGLRHSIQSGNRPVVELGSDRAVEIVPGIKMGQGSAQSITVRYGDLVRRIASVAGGRIDATSRAATLSNMPEFDIVVMRRGAPGYFTPEKYAPSRPPERPLAGQGGLVTALIGCSITSAEKTISSQEAVVMEAVSFMYIDELQGDQIDLTGLPGMDLSVQYDPLNPLGRP